MKNVTRVLSTTMAAAILLSVPVSAAEIVTRDDFTNAKITQNKWVVDNYQPDDFYTENGHLYIAMGGDGYRKNRSDECKDKSFAQQGYKLSCGEVSGASWTATVQIQLDKTWFGERKDSEVKKRLKEVENDKILNNLKKGMFRLELTDSRGKTFSASPTISIIKGGDGAPAIKYYDPEEFQSWGTADLTLANPLDTTSKTTGTVKEWYTLMITCKNNTITYAVDGQKIGSYTLEKSASPAYISLSMQNFERPDVSAWDNVRLYDGVYTYSATEK